LLLKQVSSQTLDFPIAAQVQVIQGPPSLAYWLNLASDLYPSAGFQKFPSSKKRWRMRVSDQHLSDTRTLHHRSGNTVCLTFYKEALNIRLKLDSEKLSCVASWRTEVYEIIFSQPLLIVHQSVKFLKAKAHCSYRSIDICLL
jgi:hypothetical protein